MKALRALGTLVLLVAFTGFMAAALSLHLLCGLELFPNLNPVLVTLALGLTLDALPVWLVLEAYLLGVGAVIPIIGCAICGFAFWAAGVALWPVRGQFLERLPVEFRWRWLSSGYVLAKIADLTLQIPWDRIRKRLGKVRYRRQGS